MEEEQEHCLDLEYDLWEGQFEFLGGEYQGINGKSQINGVINNNGHRFNVKKKPNWCLELNQHIQMLQQQMNVLADNQVHSDERYTRAKQENATLQARVLMLEEQLREVELRAEEKLIEEERRHRELVARVDREKQLQVENCAIRLQTLELENTSLRDEANRCRLQTDRLRNDKARFEESLSEKDATICSLRDEISMLRDNEKKHKDVANGNQQLIEEMNLEIERLQGELKVTLAKLKSNNMGVPSSAHEQLQAQFSALREENKKLQEAHDEMQAILLTRSVEEGRSLLTGNQSLAAELEAMSQDEPSEFTKDAFEVRTALKEQQEVNAQLRAYIDGILLLIVENHPQLLEVKPAPIP